MRFHPLLFFPAKKRDFASLNIIFIYFISFIVFILFTGCAASRTRRLQHAYNKAAAIKPFDAIIVPGVPLLNGSWDSTMKARVIWSWILYKNGYTKNVIYSGAAVYSSYSEAKVMGLYGKELGIPAAHIFYDTLAEHSTENVYYSYLLAKKLGLKSIALATDPFQSFMLKGFCRKRFRTPVYPLAFIPDSVAKYNYLNPVIDKATAKVKNFVSLAERKSFRKRLRGTFGRDINWRQYEGRKLPAL